TTSRRRKAKKQHPPPQAGEGHGANDGGKLSPEQPPAPKAEEQEEGESEVRSDDVVSGPLPPPSPPSQSSVSAPAEEGEANAVVGAPEGAGAEQPPVLEAKDAAPTSAAGPGASPPVRSDADEAPTKSTPGTAPHGTVQPTAAEAEKATQGVDDAVGNKNAPAGAQETPQARDASPPAGSSSTASQHSADVKPSEGKGDGTLRGCVSRLWLLALLGLWVMTALC
ncbi:trans-sialidase, partial [Trypanosoma conorhini]